MTVRPAMFPRWTLPVAAGFYALLGLSLWIVPVGALQDVAGPAATDAIGLALMVGGLTAGVGSVSDRHAFRLIELWGAIIAAAALLGYATAPLQLLLHGNLELVRLTAFAVVATMLPIGRILWILRHEL